jgi:hypothetical protein
MDLRNDRRDQRFVDTAEMQVGEMDDGAHVMPPVL